jgi:hypothetical protein
MVAGRTARLPQKAGLSNAEGLYRLHVPGGTYTVKVLGLASADTHLYGEAIGETAAVGARASSTSS